jgi:hypothetical protein
MELHPTGFSPAVVRNMTALHTQRSIAGPDLLVARQPCWDPRDAYHLGTWQERPA